jgi:hypothetical protein
VTAIAPFLGPLALLSAALLASGEPGALPCVYAAAPTAAEPAPELELHAGCAVIGEDGGLVVAPAHRSAARYVDGLAALRVDGGWYYVRPDGPALRVVTLDNGPDDRSEGRVRSPRGGGIAYVDAALREVIPPRYDWGWPFEGGRALVCVGCRPGEPDGEHRPMVGGRWGYVDAGGREVVPVTLSREEALALRTVPGAAGPPPGGTDADPEDP